MTKNKIVLLIVAIVSASCTAISQLPEYNETWQTVALLVGIVLTLIFGTTSLPKEKQELLFKGLQKIGETFFKKKTKILVFVVLVGFTASSQISCSSNPATESIIDSLEHLHIKMIVENDNLTIEQKTQLVELMEKQSDDICKLIYDLRKPLIINNAQISESAKKWWLVIVMQGMNFSSQKIDAGLSLYEEHGDIVLTDELLQTKP